MNAITTHEKQNLNEIAKNNNLFNSNLRRQNHSEKEEVISTKSKVVKRTKKNN